MRNFFIALLITIWGVVTYSKLDRIEKKVDTLTKQNIEIKLDQPEYLLSDNPERDLMDVLYHYEVQYPEIVYAQAVLETGNFNSRVCKEYNNLFGLYNSYTGDYYKFDHWVESVIGYLNYVQYRYNEDEDYYSFLKRIGYATDPNYIIKVKQIVAQIDKETNMIDV